MVKSILREAESLCSLGSNPETKSANSGITKISDAGN